MRFMVLKKVLEYNLLNESLDIRVSNRTRKTRGIRDKPYKKDDICTNVKKITGDFVMENSLTANLKNNRNL